MIAEARKRITKVETGRFQAMMDVELVNDGPVTIILDSEKTI
jgi:D-tyrosyl-tRNA(Tyr) deacylase